jgi:5-methylcytosine-specific restriction endonuclease McrA
MILESEIDNWEKCFNCIFAFYYMRGNFLCNIRNIKAREKELKGEKRKDYIYMGNNDSCDCFIPRPDGCAELYDQNKPICYFTKEDGLSYDTYEEHLDRFKNQIRKVENQTQRDIKRIRQNLGYNWTFSTSKEFVLIRDKLKEKIRIKANKYRCSECKNIFPYNLIQVHHIIERCHFGSNSPANLEIKCKFCHSLETYKLMTKKEKIPLIIQFRKVCSINYRGWKKEIKKLHRKKRIFKKLKRRQKERLERAKRKILFWKKYYLQTKRWNVERIQKRKRLREELEKKHKTLDKF